MKGSHEHPADRFKIVSRQADARFVAVAQAICGQCGKIEEIAQGGRGPLPTDVLMKKFRQREWFMGRRQSEDRCPDCMLQLRQQRRVVDFPKKKQEPAMAVETPREPSQSDKRRIRTAIDDVYIDGKNCYSSDWSDQKLAEKLNVPRAWVTTIREDFYGPGVNEATDQVFSAFDKRLRDLEERALAVASEAEGLRKEIGVAKRQAGIAA